MAMEEYTWIFVLTIIFSFLGACGIGANDVANAFSSSVGSGALTMKQAILAAGIFEFCGAFFMGASVTKTIRKGITSYEYFEEDPAILLYGMFCVCVANAFWLALATFLKMPVSTTHTCVGGIMGFSLVWQGRHGVDWEVVTWIIISWFLSPIFSGIVAAIFHKIIRVFIMDSVDPYKRAIYGYPIIVWFTFFICIFFTLFKGTPELSLKKKMDIGWIMFISFCCAALLGAISWFVVVPWVTERIEKADEEKRTVPVEKAETCVEMGQTDDAAASYVSKTQDYNKEVVEISLTITNDVASPTEEDDVCETSLATDKTSGFVDIKGRLELEATPELKRMLDGTKKFDKKAERVFISAQVLSACFAAFAHGSNDVANSIGPLAAVYAIWTSGEVSKKSSVELWILTLGGVGIVVGLFLYGWKIMQVIGFELTKISPSRGLCIELAAAAVVIIGSANEIPLSTTHCQVGAVLGVGMMEGVSNVNCTIMPRIMLGWILTLLVAGCGSALLFAFGVYSPSDSD